LVKRGRGDFRVEWRRELFDELGPRTLDERIINL
jgi:hypothetical protein